MYALIQCPGANNNYMQIVRLENTSELSPAGYVIGPYKIIFPKLKIQAARKIMTALNKG